MAVFSRADSGYWWLYLETTHRKERTEFKVGTTTAQRKDSRRLAEDRYHQRMNELALDRYGLSEPERTTFKAHATWWLTHVAGLHKGVSREDGIVKRLIEAFDETSLEQLTKHRVQEWITARSAPHPTTEKRIAAGTMNRELDVLKQILNSAVPTYLRASPLFKLRRVKGTSIEARVLSVADERKLLKTLPPSDRAIVLLGLDCLLRLSDVINLQRVHDHRTHLSIVNPKTTPYRVPVSSRLRKALDAVPAGGPYYFEARRQATKSRDYKSSVKSMLRRACARAGIAYGRGVGITFHALRHTGATRMVLAGVPLRLVQTIGGWKSLRQLERYAHPTDAANRAAVETIGRRKRFG